MKAWEQFLTLTKFESLRNEVMIAIFIVNGGCTSVKKLRLYEPGKHFHQAHLFLSSWWIIHTQDGWRLWRRTNLRPLRREYFDAEMSSFYLIEVNGSLNERQVKWRLRISNVDAQDWDWEFSKLVVKLSCDQKKFWIIFSWYYFYLFFVENVDNFSILHLLFTFILFLDRPIFHRGIGGLYSALLSTQYSNTFTKNVK